MFWRAYEKTVEFILINPIRRWYSFEPSPSRWGTFSFLTSASFFFWSVWASLYAICITIVGGTVVLPVSADVFYWSAVIGFGLAILFGIFAGILGIYFLRTQGKDPQYVLLNRLIDRLEPSQERVEDIGLINKRFKAGIKRIKRGEVG